MTRTYRIDLSKPVGHRLIDVTETKTALEELAAARAEYDRAIRWRVFKQEQLMDAKEEVEQADREFERATSRLKLAIESVPDCENAAFDGGGP